MITDSRYRHWFQSLNADGKYAFALLLLAATLTLPALGGESWRLAWRYDRAALAAGEYWRLASAHLVHLGPRHLLFNLAGLVLLWVMFARAWRPVQWLGIVAISALFIDVGLWYCMPQLSWYLGASGVLHGVWSAGAWSQWRVRVWQSALPLLLLCLKLASEQWRAASLVLDTSPVVLNSHLFGALGGLCLPLFWSARRWRQSAPL